MNKKKMYDCPLCGEKKSCRRKPFTDTITGYMDTKVTFENMSLYCNNCNESFSNKDDKMLYKALTELRIEIVKKILGDFKKRKIRFSSLERILGLPQRTFSKYLENSEIPTQETKALLIILHKNQHLIEEDVCK